jgi:hypothetical protein
MKPPQYRYAASVGSPIVHVLAPEPHGDRTVCGKPATRWTPRGAPRRERGELLCASCDRMKDADTMYGRGSRAPAKKRAPRKVENAFAYIDDGLIWIRVHVGVLGEIVRFARYSQELEHHEYVVVDAMAFARALVDELNREPAENVSTFRQFLDEACAAAIENGAEGVEKRPRKAGAP